MDLPSRKVLKNQLKVIVYEMFDRVANWDDYVHHYVSGGVYRSKGFFSSYISADRLAVMLPSYVRPDVYNGKKYIRRIRNRRSSCSIK